MLPLKVFNSLSQKKEIFEPNQDGKIMWYSCGPTVYDSAHMGHARSYITFDIIRRILVHHFKYNLVYIMNITDIDDKIITRARQEYFFSQYIEKMDISSYICDLLLSINVYGSKNVLDPDMKIVRKGLLMKANESLDDIKLIDTFDIKNDFHLNIVKNAKPVFVEWLDSQLASTITKEDNCIFFDLPKKFEIEFFSDMEALNVETPDILTRVSEFIPEIVQFIETIIENGYAYESNDSVYFDTIKFSKEKTYGKLKPEALSRINDILESEGSLSQKNTGEKRASVDFALWKKSNLGEPSWESPWGVGRPGWHIECSVMAAAGGSKKLDIHAGGVDLAFPHHENEIAQSEACYNDKWVNYFLHSGHLTIEGCKMSKSLKNFITISDALKKYSFVEIRVLFLLHVWTDTLDYGESTMQEASIYCKMIKSFFLNVNDVERKWKGSQQNAPKWTLKESTLELDFEKCCSKIEQYISENFDTKNVLLEIKQLVSLFNIYYNHYDKQKNMLYYPIIQRIAKYIYEKLKVFGLLKDVDTYRFMEDSSFLVECSKCCDFKAAIYAFSDFRKVIREQALSVSDVTFKKKILSECDKLRDETLPPNGVQLSDKNDDICVRFEKQIDLVSTVSSSSKDVEKERDMKRQINPQEMFKFEKMDDGNAKYTKFDVDGLPTHDSKNQILPKSQLKKINKKYQAQKKKYETHLLTQK